MRAALLLLVLTACTPRITFLGDAGPQTLILTGEVCATYSAPVDFPVKVVLLVDQSGSMCVTDPPGSQASPGFCESVAPDAGVTVPSRVRALQQLLSQFFGATGTSVALVPFATNVSFAPLTPGASPFKAPNDPGLLAQVAALPAQLGTASDLQGALEFAERLIAFDLNQVQASTPELLLRSRYVVLVVSDGPPSPRCAAADTLTTYADDTNPGLTWPDSSTSCNTAVLGEPGGIDGFTGGEARNQNDQLFAVITKLDSLGQQYGVGDIRVHTVLLFNQEALEACGPLCQDLYGSFQRWPGPVAVPSTQSGLFAHAQATWLLRELALRGHGSFSEFVDNAGIAAMSFAPLDFKSLAAPKVLQRFLVQPLRAVESAGAWVPDSDGDGASDERELAAGTDPRLGDTDGDGFDDGFELSAGADGFDPLVRDLRGCDPASARTPNCVVSDAEGDGLSQFAEAYFGTSPLRHDTDGDGFPDGLEVRAGLSPTVALSTSTDTDGDGLTDAEELMRGADPLHADRTFSEQLGFETTITEESPFPGQPGPCYLFTTTQLPMVATLGAEPRTPAGLGLFRLWFLSAPPSIVGDRGEWLSACAWARRDGPVRIPSDLVLAVWKDWFSWPYSLQNLAIATCAGGAALAP